MAVGFIYNMIQADKNEALAEKRNSEAFYKMYEAEAKLIDKENEVRQSVMKLANRKRGILRTSINEFIQVYEIIKKIEFEPGQGILELTGVAVLEEQVKELKMGVDVSGAVLTTSQTIATYLLGDVFKGNFGGMSGVIAKEAEMNAAIASKRKQQARVIEAQADTISLAMDAVGQRAERITSIITRLNSLFRKSLKELQNIVEKNGLDKSLYTRADKEVIMTSVNIVTGLKDLLDTPLFDRDGELTQKSFEAIQVGDDYLKELGKL